MGNNADFEQDENMGGNIIPIIAVIVAVIIIGGLLWWANRDRGTSKDQDQNQNQADIDFSSTEEQAVKLLNSDKFVRIQGINAEHATNIDAVLRHYEATAGAEVDADGELAWIYNQIQPAVEQWFDPEFDLIAAFSAVEHTEESDGSLAWLSVPLSESLKTNPDAFYFRLNEEKGDYEMSAGYYLMGYAYSGMNQVIETGTAETGTESETNTESETETDTESVDDDGAVG